MLGNQQQQPKRRRQSVVRGGASATRTALGRRVSSRFEDEERRFSMEPPFPTPHRRRLLSDVMSHTSHFKQAKSAVMCVGNVPTTTGQFYYSSSGPADRYDIVSGPRNSIDLVSPKRRTQRRLKEVQPQTSADLLSACSGPASALWKLPEVRTRTGGAPRSARVSVASSREFKSNSEQLNEQPFRHSLSMSQPLREKRSHTVQLQKIPAFSTIPLMEGSLEFRRTSMRDDGILAMNGRPTPRRRMSQMSHYTARHSERARSPSRSSSSEETSSRDRAVVSGGSSSPSSTDLTRTMRLQSTASSGSTSQMSASPGLPLSGTGGIAAEAEEDNATTSGSSSKWITFTDTWGSGNWQSKIVLRFAPNFWWNDYNGTSPVEQALHEAFTEVWSDPKRRECLIQESCLAMEQGLVSCGRGLLEVERSLHRLLTHPPGTGPLPPHLVCGGGEALPISRPKLETGGPSFFICVRPPRGVKSPPRIPYLSDCYDKITNEQDLRQAWFYLVRSGTSALISQMLSHKSSEPIVLSLCTRHFVKYAYIGLTKEDSSMRQGVTVYPLSKKLRWNSSADREDISTLSHCICAWLRSA